MARLLGDVQLVVDTLKSIIQVVAHRGVKSDGHFIRLPCLEEGSRPLHEAAQLLAGHLQLVQGVLVGVDAGHIALADGACAHLGGHGGQGRCGDLRTGVVHLHFVDEVQQRGVLHHGLRQAVDLVFGGQIAALQLANGGNSVFLGAGVVGSQQSGQLRIGLVLLDLQVFRGAVHDLPLTVQLALQIDVDLGQGGTGVLVLHHQHVVDHHVGDAPVAVAAHDDVELGAGIGQIGDAGAIDTVLVLGIHVHDADQNIHLILDLINDLAALVHRVGDLPALQILGIPADDVGGDHANDTDLDGALLDDGVAVGQRGAVRCVNVAGEHLGLLLSHDLFQHIHAVVVLMVAGGPDIIADGIHGSDHGMQVIVQEQLCGVGLNGIACIHHQRVPGAALLDGGRLLGHTAGSICLVGSVVPWVEFAVGIAGGKDLQIHAPQGLDVTGGCRGCHAAGGCDGCGCPCTTQEAAAGDLVLSHS